MDCCEVCIFFCVLIGRNVPGTFAMFGGKAIVDQFLPEHQDKTDFFRHFVGAIFGGSLAILVSSPMVYCCLDL